jgi:hypothetical protein
LGFGDSPFSKGTSRSSAAPPARDLRETFVPALSPYQIHQPHTASGSTARNQAAHLHLHQPPSDQPIRQVPSPQSAHTDRPCFSSFCLTYARPSLSRRLARYPLRYHISSVALVLSWLAPSNATPSLNPAAVESPRRCVNLRQSQHRSLHQSLAHCRMCR